MIVGFDKMDETIIKNFRGGNNDTITKIYTDNMNRIMYGKLEPGSSIGLHEHDSGSEIVYILGGKGKAIYDNEEEELYVGVCHYCPKGHTHSLINDGLEDLIFFAVIPQQ